jgi:hypothetical protein
MSTSRRTAVAVPVDRSAKPRSRRRGSATATVGAASYPSCPAPGRSEVRHPEGKEDQNQHDNHDDDIITTPAAAGAKAACNSVYGRLSTPTASPDSLISELVSRRTTVETPSSPQPPACTSEEDP